MNILQKFPENEMLILLQSEEMIEYILNKHIFKRINAS